MIKNVLITLLFCSLTAQAQKPELTFTEVLYQETAPGLDTYGYRLLVNQQFIRFDAGIDDDGYILFDRAKKTIVSVNHEDQTRFLLKPQQSDFNGTLLEVKTLSSDLAKAPMVQGTKAQMHDILVNQSLCRQVVSFAGLLPEVTQAWSDYEALLQSQNQQILSSTPKNMQTDCFMVNNMTHANLFLQYGLPFSVKSKDGTVRILSHFSSVSKPSSMVSIPEHYRELSLQ